MMIDDDDVTLIEFRYQKCSSSSISNSLFAQLSTHNAS